jgi:hypothetical protein
MVREGRNVKGGAYLLSPLLLGEHFIFLRNYLGFVLEDESERQADEEGRGRDYPDYISGKFCGAFEEGRCF